MEPMGIYSEKFQSVDDVKDGSLVALADNPANTARGLRLLEAAGLITLADDFDAYLNQAVIHAFEQTQKVISLL